MPVGVCRICGSVLLFASWLVFVQPAMAHHILGRPAYSLNEDSNTPPAMQVETQAGDFFLNYMVFPAFPKSGEPGRINLYASRISSGKPFEGKVTFKIRGNSWLAWFGLGAAEEQVGVQSLDDAVFRQGFMVNHDGDYLITAQFRDGQTPYAIDFPLRIGAPSRIGPIGIAVVVIVIILAGVSLIQRRRAMTGKIRKAQNASYTGNNRAGRSDD